MANKTLNFGVTLLDPNQAQKDVTVNEALVTFDSFIQPSVISAAITTPPSSPSDQDKYIVPAGATGAWSGQVNAIAVYQDNGSRWTFYPPKPGWLVFNQATGALWVRLNLSWMEIGLTGQIDISPVRGTFTLPANVSSYVVTASVSPAAASCTLLSDVVLIPQTLNANDEVPLAIPGVQEFTLTCANNPLTDRTYNFRIFN